MRAQLTKTNPTMIAWAIEESGYNIPTLAEKLSGDDVAEGLIEDWLCGRTTPTRGQLSKLAEVLKRQKVVFYMKEPPPTAGPQLQLRSAAGVAARPLTPDERVLVRKAVRRQEFVAWLLRDREPIALPSASEEVAPAAVAVELRSWLGMSPVDRRSWQSDRNAYRAWKRRVEGRGILVMELRIGADGIRGFSVNDKQAPLIAVNTAYSLPARLFTLLHELAHIMLGSTSSCLPDAFSKEQDTERWCDRVAGACLLPREELLHVLRTSGSSYTMDFVKQVASEFHSSLRAAVIALGEIDDEFRQLYSALRQPIRQADTDKPAAKGGSAKQRPELRFGEIGLVASRAVANALEADEIGELEARRALNLDGYELDVLGELVRQAESPLP